MSEQAKVFTVAEAAALLKKSPKRIRVYIKRRYFAATKPEGFSNWLINADSLHSYLSRGANHDRHAGD